jgi:hypothetical protein
MTEPEGGVSGENVNMSRRCILKENGLLERFSQDLDRRQIRSDKTTLPYCIWRAAGYRVAASVKVSYRSPDSEFKNMTTKMATVPVGE